MSAPGERGPATSATPYRGSRATVRWLDLQWSNSYAVDDADHIVAYVDVAHEGGRLAASEIGVEWSVFSPRKTWREEAPLRSGVVRCPRLTRAILRMFGLGAVPHFMAVHRAQQALSELGYT